MSLAESPSPAQSWKSLESFFAFVLLNSSTPCSSPTLPSSLPGVLHSHLVRLACAVPALQVSVARLLVGCLPLYNLHAEHVRSWLLPSLADLTGKAAVSRRRAASCGAVMKPDVVQ
jgi:hypothetical protein